MEAERTYQNKVARTIQQQSCDGALEFTDNRRSGILQATANPIQRIEDEEEPLQGKFEQPVQRLGEEDEDDPVQGKFEQPVQRRKNETGLPDGLKAGLEQLSGISLDPVKVHYNSDKPAAVQAHAYTQGTDIFIAPGQEQYVPHEAAHAIDQMTTDVPPTTERGGLPVNDDPVREKRADDMGKEALSLNL